MPRKKKAPELTFQQHIADYLIREHKYGKLEQADITDTEHFIAEDRLWAFLKATQADTIKKLTDDYGTDAREEIFKALRKELEHTPLVDITFILSDRKSLDTNIREDIEKFTHLKDVVGIAKKADDLPRFLKQRKSIIVTTQQKFAWVLEEIQKNPELKKLRVAFLIDESHRSHPREVFADALADRASAVIVAHNHPSGGLEPSQGDRDITVQLKAAGSIIGIELLDHIIFNRTGYFSFLESGAL